MFAYVTTNMHPNTKWPRLWVRAGAFTLANIAPGDSTLRFFNLETRANFTMPLQATQHGPVPASNRLASPEGGTSTFSSGLTAAVALAYCSCDHVLGVMFRSGEVLLLRHIHEDRYANTQPLIDHYSHVSQSGTLLTVLLFSQEARQLCEGLHPQPPTRKRIMTVRYSSLGETGCDRFSVLVMMLAVLGSSVRLNRARRTNAPFLRTPCNIKTDVNCIENQVLSYAKVTQVRALDRT
jgi:hypothetical protein